MAEFVKTYWRRMLIVVAILLVVFIGINVYLEAATSLLPGGGKG